VWSWVDTSNIGHGLGAGDCCCAPDGFLNIVGMVMEQSVLWASPEGRYLKTFVEVERSAPWSVVLMGRSLMILVRIAGGLPAWDVFRFRDEVEAEN
jgi:hypothetical protein